MEHRVFKIMSVHNAAVKEAMEIERKRSEHKNQAFLIEGTNLVEAALDASRAKVARLFYTEAYLERQGQTAEALLALAARRGAEIFEVVASVMERICDTETPQGIAAIASCDVLPLGSIEIEAGPVVVSDGVSDPGNMGALIRAADAAGAAAVILLEGSCDAFSQKALRASAGSIFNVPLVYGTREALPDALKAKGVRMLATSAHSGQNVYEVDMKPPVAMVFGGETAGVSEALAKASESTVRIPMRGMAESLNVAASAAVCLYECVRQMSMPSALAAPAQVASAHIDSAHDKPRNIEAGGLEPPRFDRRVMPKRRAMAERRTPAERREKPLAGASAAGKEGARDYRDQRGRRDQRDLREQRDRRDKPVEQWPRANRSVGEGSWEDVKRTARSQAGGNVPRSDRPQAARPYSDRPRSDRPQGARPYSDRPRSDRPQAARPYSDRPRSDRPQGARPYSDRPRSDRPQGARPYSDRPRSDRPTRSYADHPHSERPQSARPYADRPWADRQRTERTGSSDRPSSAGRRPTSGIERKGPGSYDRKGPAGPKGPRGAGGIDRKGPGGPRGGGRKKY